MIRVILYLALVALIALGVVWVADRPGDVTIVWLGYRIETSMMVAVVAVGAAIAAVLLLWSLIRTVLRSPDLIAMFLGHRRGVRGYLAISRGLVAIGAGDLGAARKFAGEADKIAPAEPLALLLNAQCAQLAGDRTAAEFAFRAMAERKDTRLLGLRGLYVEAQRRADGEAARGYAEEAAKAGPSLTWAGQAVLEFRCAAGDWTGALAALDRNYRYSLIDKPGYRRQRAVFLTARALAAEEDDPERARALALEAVKLAPALVPAADLAARMLGERGEYKKASRIVEAAWKVNPHPDLAETFAHLRAGESARDRLTRMQSLAQKAPPGDPESALAVARAALDASEFAAARDALRPFLAEPTQRVAVLMSEIEQRESGDEGRAREWMARALRAARDPAWTADGLISDRWMPVSPVSGRIDAFQWKVPLAELGDHRDAIEIGEPSPAPPPAPLRPVAAELEVAPPETAVEIAQREDFAAEAKAASRGVAPQLRAAPPPRVDTVIPLVHVPDDPGPEPQTEAEPQVPPDARRRSRAPK